MKVKAVALFAALPVALLGMFAWSAIRGTGNAAPDYVHALFEVWNANEFGDNGQPMREAYYDDWEKSLTTTRSVAEMLRKAADKPRFEPSAASRGKQPVSVGQLLKAMSKVRLAMRGAALEAAERGDFKSAFDYATTLGKMSLHAGSVRSGSKYAKELEEGALDTWWSVVDRHADKPQVVKDAHVWLESFERLVTSTTDASDKRSNFSRVVARVQKRNITRDPGRHAALQVAKVAFALLETPGATIQDLKIDTTDPYSGERLRTTTSGGFVVYSVGPNRRDDGGSMYDVRFRRSDRWRYSTGTLP